MIIDLEQATIKIIKLQTHTGIQTRINNNNLYPVQYSHNTKTGLRLWAQIYMHTISYVLYD